MIPEIIDHIHAPVAAPPMPRKLSIQPPTTAPTMPMMIVTIIPPGSSPGIISLANAPAMRPTMIQKISAPSIRASFALYLLCLQVYSLIRRRETLVSECTIYFLDRYLRMSEVLLLSCPQSEGSGGFL